MQKRAKRAVVGTALYWVCVLGAGALMIAVLTMFLMGFRTYAITGGSMEPTIGKGALIVTRVMPVSELTVGDIITYRPPGRTDLVTHRIISVQPQLGGTPLFQTRGDANQAADPWVFTLDSQTQARYVFQLPYLGYVLLGFGTPLVRTVVLVALGLLLTTMAFLKLWREAGETQEDCGGEVSTGYGSSHDAVASLTAQPTRSVRGRHQ